MKKCFFAMLTAALSCASVSAAVDDTFEIDGLLYTVTSESPATVSVMAPPYTFAVSGELVISSTVSNDGTEYTVTSLPAQAFQYCRGLTKATIPSTISSIIYNAFYRCNNVTEIIVDENNPTYCSVDGIVYTKDMTTLVICPEGKTGEFSIPESVTEIGTNALNGCTGLTSIIIPDGVTKIGTYSLYLCEGIKSITIPAKATATDTFLGRCSSLEEIIVDPDSETFCSVDGVMYTKDMTKIMQYPVARTSEITFPESVTQIGSFSYSDCEAVTTVNIPARITAGQQAFCYCPNLTEYNVDENNTVYSSVDGVLYNKRGSTLYGCPTVRTGAFIVPDNVTVVGGNAFRGSNLSTIIIPATVTQISGQTFQDCHNLTKLVCLSPTPRTISYATIANTPSSMVVYVPKGSKEAYEQAWPMLHNFEEIDAFMVALPSSEEAVGVGETLDLVPTIVKIDEITVSSEVWSSSNSAVASVDQSGKVTGVAPGKATITVTVTDELGQTSTDNCEVTVSANADIIEIGVDSQGAIDYTQPLSVYDLSGKKLADNLRNLASGIYIVRQNAASAKILVK